MKAITIRQPWAGLIIMGAKTIETRSRACAYRGELAIHAAKTYGTSERVAAAIAAREFGRVDLAFGAVLGIVELVDCRPVEDWLPTLPAHELAFGDYRLGRYGWLMRVIERFPEPVPAKGALSFWTWRRR